MAEHDVLQVDGINSKGYGIIPKLAMQDKRLSATAKAIYAYFCSYAGAGKTAFPSVGKITSDLDISRNNYYKHLGQLKDCGYLKAEQEHINGRLTRNVYTLLDSIPANTIQSTKIWDTVQCTKKQDTVKQDTVNWYTNNNSSKINSSKNISQSETDGQDPGCSLSFSEHSAAFRSNINYPDFERTHPDDMYLLDEIVNIAADVWAGSDPTVRIDGENKPRAAVQLQLKGLGYDHVKHVIEQFKSQPQRIKKKRQYLLTMLYNSSMELDAHFTNMLSSDTAKENRHQCDNTGSGEEQDTASGILPLQGHYTLSDNQNKGGTEDG